MAKAIVEIAKKAEILLSDPTQVKEIAGKGICAQLNQHTIMVGNESWLRAEGIDFSLLVSRDLEDSKDYSSLFIAESGKCLGWIGLEDKTRQDARKATEQLKEIGCHQIILLTGDKWNVAKRVSQELGCTEVQAECLPETKLSLVESKKKAGYRVMVVGDGINDAPALASGNVGVAMGVAGSDIAINSADIALLNNQLDRLPFLILLAKKTRRIIHQNLVFGVLFIITGLTLSGIGMLTPVLGAILHNIGAFVIIFNSARLVRFGEELMPDDLEKS
jgi:Cd2+/Zn2+-exporting ATPase